MIEIAVNVNVINKETGLVDILETVYIDIEAIEQMACNKAEEEFGRKYNYASQGISKITF